MTVKEYLKQAMYLDALINSKVRQAEHLRSLATKVTTTYSDQGVSSEHDNKRLEKTIAKIIDLEREINDDIDTLIDLKIEITAIISQVTDIKQRLILEKRYLDFESWEQISCDLKYNIRHIRRLHNESIKKISEKMSENVLECPAKK